MLPEYIQILLSLSIALNIALIALRISARRARSQKFNSKCRKCGYDIRSTISNKCPECGEIIVAPSPLRRELTHCSFCGKSNRQTGRQVEGPAGAYICSTCVDVAAKLLAQAEKKSQTHKNSSN
jgi:hypothetical protein